MSAIEMTIKIIRERVAVINTNWEELKSTSETFERFRNELMGMMIILKNIDSSDKFYNIQYFDNGIKFGYYNENGRWWMIEG